MSAGQVTCGGVVSTTVTVNVQLLEAPPLSVAVHVTLLAPRRKPVPEGGMHVTGRKAPVESCARASKVTGVRPPVHSAVRLGGQVMVGGGAPCTVMSTFAEAMPPWPSAIE